MNKNNNILNIFNISLLIFISKWIFSFYFYKESLDVKIIFESVGDGKLYYPFIKYLSDLNLNNSYDPFINNLKIIPIPIASLIYHSIFLKIIGNVSFLIIEFISIFIFLLIFMKIFSYFFSEKYSIIFALFLFILPSTISILNIQEIPYVNLIENNFYTLRVPRPMIASLYFFAFIYLIISMNFNLFYTKKNFFLLGALLGLSLSSFYYNFFIEFLSFIFFLIYKFKTNILKEFINNLKYYLIALLTFVIFVSPFLINLFFHETDFTNRLCIFELNYYKKITLLAHYLSNYVKINFLIFFSIISLLVFMGNKLKITKFEIVNIFI